MSTKVKAANISLLNNIKVNIRALTSLFKEELIMC
jgi:hypothetical protein